MENAMTEDEARARAVEAICRKAGIVGRGGGGGYRWSTEPEVALMQDDHRSQDKCHAENQEHEARHSVIDSSIE